MFFRCQVLARVEARQAHLEWLANAAARMGDATNAPAYLSPTALGHLVKWAVIPWCDELTRVGESDALEESSTPAQVESRESPFLRVQAARKLLAFETREQQESVRLSILRGCC
eukprot:SAG31_NODE_11084_length_1068_cov_0.848297_2_plen_114_part_00